MEGTAENRYSFLGGVGGVGLFLFILYTSTFFKCFNNHFKTFKNK